MENELCWKCRDYYLNKYGSNCYFTPNQHCHHEPKEKEKCWCEYAEKERTGRYPTKGALGFKALYCPECGKKLTT
jgi:hypothetical protein